MAHQSSDLTEWDFTALGGDNKGIFRLEYRNGAFGKPYYIGQYWVGANFDPLPQGTVVMDQAIEVLVKEGFTDGFASVAMGTPNVPNPQPMFGSAYRLRSRASPPAPARSPGICSRVSPAASAS